MNTPNAFTAVIEDATNRLLRLDPETLRRLGDIQGKVICVRINGKDNEGPVFYFSPSEGGLQMRNEFEGKPDVTISGNFSAFMRLIAGERAQGAFANGEMQISGDLELGQRFQRVLKKLDIDWEEIASHYVGDVLAHKLGNLARGFRAWGRQAHETLREDTREYLQEEVRLLPRAEHVESLLDEIDQFRSDVARLEKRIRRLQGER
ncbi:MAG: SCP2 sterol-binding domain-containing protein [Acidiferrobacterales bacterium]|jgi:ubiquinone biosynthesis protein UbiJ|nr:SCP2 sterol-binding domain-containing protein [Acidiferrobacterales bacterium]